MAYGLNVSFQMKPGMADEFLEEISRCGVHEEIRREEGCLQYDFYRSVEDRDLLLLVERWTDRAAQQRHLERPHMERFGAIRDRCLATPSHLLGYDL